MKRGDGTCRSIEQASPRSVSGKGSISVLSRIILLAAAQACRSGISSDDDGDRKGLFRLTQAEWDANSNDDDFDIHFTPAQISSPLRQCAVFALMTNRAFSAFVKANNRNPSTKELYLQQFPGADTTGLQKSSG